MSMHLAGEVRRLTILAWPILLAQVAQNSMGFVDTLIAGRAGTLDLAAVALGSAFWMPLILFGQGILLVITPMVARLRGQNADESAIGHEMRQGIWLALLLSPVLAGILWTLIALLPRFGYEPALTDMCQRYLRACMWGLPGYMLFVALRCALDGLGRVRAAMIATIVGLGLNVAGNVIFALGKLGVPAYGGVGTGIATAIVCWCLSGMMLIQSLRMADIRRWLSPENWDGPHAATLRRVLAVGLPTAFALLCEVSMFAAIAALIAPLGSMALAANQIAISLSGMMFMLPLSISMATTIRIGINIGELSPEGARLSARAGMALGLVSACFTAVGIVLLRNRIPYLFTDDPLVAASASTLMILMACYQFPDALQVVSVGALRAYNDTRAVLGICFVTYWCVGLPLGHALGRTDAVVEAMGARGFWIAIIVGLTLAAALMLIRLRQRERMFGAHARASSSRSAAPEPRRGGNRP